MVQGLRDDFFDEQDDFLGVGFGDSDAGAVIMTERGVDAVVNNNFPRYAERTTKATLQEIFRLSNGTAGTAIDLDVIVVSNIALGGPGVIMSSLQRLADWGYIQTGMVE